MILLSLKQQLKLDSQDIQFDYVRFPEGFENEADSLTYSKGDYKNSKLSSAINVLIQLQNFRTC